jgi:hypothetical protein
MVSASGAARSSMRVRPRFGLLWVVGRAKP